VLQVLKIVFGQKLPDIGSTRTRVPTQTRVARPVEPLVQTFELPDLVLEASVGYNVGLSDSEKHESVDYPLNRSPSEDVGGQGCKVSGPEYVVGVGLRNKNGTDLSLRAGMGNGAGENSWSEPTTSLRGRPGTWDYDAETDMERYLAGVKLGHAVKTDNGTVHFEAIVDAVFEEIEGNVHANGRINDPTASPYATGQLNQTRNADWSCSPGYGRLGLGIGYGNENFGVMAGATHDFGRNEEITTEIGTNVQPPPGARITSTSPGRLRTTLEDTWGAFVKFFARF